MMATHPRPTLDLRSEHETGATERSFVQGRTRCARARRLPMATVVRPSGSASAVASEPELSTDRFSTCTNAKQHHRYGRGQDAQIDPQAPVGDVMQVVVKFGACV